MSFSSGNLGSGDADHWGMLWKLDVPPKVQVFWWRVLHNALPSKAELKRRHVTKESFCEVCGHHEESMYHVLFECTVARRFWREVEKLMGLKPPDLHPSSWASDVLDPGLCSSRLSTMIVCGSWALWTGRNARRHGRKVWEPGASARYISSLLEDLASLKMTKKAKLPAPRARWEQPSPGWFKINTDAGFDQASSTGRAGIIIRDHTGAVVGGAARWFDDVQDALTAEALAAREGMELAVELGLDRVLLEMDCQGLANLLKDSNSIRSSIGGLCFDITELGKSFLVFDSCWVRT